MKNRNRFTKLMLGLTALCFAVNINEDEPEGGMPQAAASEAVEETTEAVDQEAEGAVEGEEVIAEGEEAPAATEPTDEPAVEL